MLTIDGSQGEGGGQILRSSLALAMLTGTPFTIENIRAKRDKPGLMRQHLTAVNAAVEVCAGFVEGAAIGSQELSFAPEEVLPGDYHFQVGSAGSATLVLQTVLPPLLVASEPSLLVLEGGTHNPFAPPFDFLAQAFLPLVNRMGPRVSVKLERTGFYPGGGGRITVDIKPARKLKKLELLERGRIRRRLARAAVSNLPVSIAHRELKVVQERLGWDESELEAVEIQGSPGPGNILTLTVESEHVTEVFTGFGQRGRRAEVVAGQAADDAERYLASGVPVSECLADQLLLPLAMAGRGAYVTSAVTGHARTSADVTRQFLDIETRFERLNPRAWRVTVG